MALVLCVRCRAGTPAGEANAPVPCRTCGTVLPAPGTRTWWVARGDAQFGPYTFAELATYVGDGRVLPSDSAWHDGAAVRTEISQLPGLKPGAPPPAPIAGAAPAVAAATINPGFAPTGTPPWVDRLKRDFVRAVNWNLATVPVEPDEEHRLITNGVDEEDARRYLVWRRSVLQIVAIPTLLTAVIATLAFLGQDKQGFSALGLSLEVGRLAALYALPVTAWLAAKCWDNHRKSRAVLLRGWLIAFLTPLLLALFPYSWRVDLSGGDPNAISQATALISLLGAIAVYITLMPAVLSLIPGVLRACLRIKTLIPESILPGLFLIAATPLYVLLFLVIFTTINQVAGNLLLILAVLALLAAPVLYLFHSNLFMQPLRTPEEVDKIGQVQKKATLIVGIGLGLLVLYAVTAQVFNRSLIGMDANTSFMRPWSLDLIQFPIEYFVRSLFTTVLVADLILMMNLALWRQTRAFQAMPEAAAYDRLMIEIEEAGGDKLMPTDIIPRIG